MKYTLYIVSNKFAKIFALAFLMMCANVAMAQLSKESNNFSLSITGGYSNLLHNIEGTSAAGGFGGGIGIGYEYRLNNFYMHIGVDAMSLNSMTKFAPFDEKMWAFDTENDEMEYHYKFDSWEDKMYSAYVSLPLIFGFNSKTFYAGAGLKIGVPVFGSNTQSSSYRTTGIYEEFIGEFEDMPNHFYTGYLGAATDEKMKFKANFSVVAELGFNVWESKPKRRDKGKNVIKLGLYAEYGMLNIAPKNDLSRNSYIINPENASQITTVPLFNSKLSKDHSLNPLYVGIKATFLFEAKKAKRCSCLQTKSGISWRRTQFRR